MDEQRRQAYINLIDALLECPEGQENEILQAHRDLVDPGLVQVMEQVAARMAEEGNPNASRLRRFAARLAVETSEASATWEDYWNFLIEVLQAVRQNPAPEAVYPLLKQNLDKLDTNFWRVLQDYGECLQQQEPETARDLAADINNFSIRMWEFPLGDRAINLEIAIAGYEICLTVFLKEEFPQEWATTQISLGIAYDKHIAGDRSENIEMAIACYKEALKVYTPTAFPVQWAATQNNLGTAYWDRIAGERSENIQRAIICYHDALKVYTPTAFPVQWATTQYNLGNAYSDQIAGERGENIQRAIICYHDALKVYTPTAFPVQWAATQNNLGNAYSNEIAGDRRENIEKAIACYHDALKVRTPSALPVQWATTQNNLGNAYLNRIAGERSENIERAIACYHDALKVYTPSALPVDWAMTQNNLGAAYYDRIAGERSENIERAIAYYHYALKVNTPSAFPVDWAGTQHNLGNAYLYRIGGERRENIERAIACYHDALKVYTTTAFPVDWAMTQNNLGNAYNYRIAGERSDNLERAIACYHDALKVRTSEAFPVDWAGTQNNLGNAYRDRIAGERGENLEQAICCYHDALKVYTPTAFPVDWARTQNNLGNAYGNRIAGERSENLERAIACYHDALKVTTPTAFPVDWATTQNNLGNAYLYRIAGERSEDLERAIACYHDALKVTTPTAFPVDWAMTQNNLGNAYLYRIAGERSEDLERAIACYHDALKVTTPTAFPVDWARTQNNLGNAYCHRIAGKRSENIERAIACYHDALKVLTPEALPVDWAMTQNNLGAAYSDRIAGERSQNLERAIACCNDALKVYTTDAFPVDWARTQNNLGAAYQKRITGERSENIERAIACYHDALKVRTPTAFPVDWATTQNNLGYAYRNRIAGERSENIERAIACYKDALTVRTPTAFPLKCLETGRNLGNTAFTAGFWETAIAGYALAIEAVEKSRAWATTEERRQEILQQSIGVFDKMVQSCVNTGQLDKALEYVERSRSQRLADLIAHNDLYAQGEIPPEIQEIIGKINHLQQQIDRKRSEENPQREDRELVGTSKLRCDKAALAARNEEIAALEAEKLLFRQQLYKLDPAIAGLHLNITQLQKLIDQPTTAILSFYSTKDDTHIFILGQNQITLHTCTEQGRGTLQNWLWENWLDSYCHEKETWKQQITSILRELAQRLRLNELIPQHLQGIRELILIPHQYLHQIPFAALPLREGEYLGDKFLIRTLPSCQILDFCHQNRSPLAPLRKGGTGQVPLSKGDLGGSLTMGIVEDATSDLPLTSWEAQTVAQQYDIPDRLRLKGPKAKVREYQKLLQQVNSLLSTHHAQSRLDNPLESALILADGKITLGQMLTPGWRHPHLEEVFLSCCETNLANANLTDDILTIGIGFLCGGVRSVISTLWAVNDIATAIFSIFYHQYRQGTDKEPAMSRPEALQKAQQQLRTLTNSEVQEMLSSAERAVEQRADEVKKTSRKEWYEQLALAWKISKAQEKLEQFGEIPFASPQYWGAFICQGLP